MSAMAAMNSSGNKSRLDVTLFPGLSQQAAESKRVRKEHLRQLVKNVKFDDHFEELLPGEKVMGAIDVSLSGGAEQVSVPINDLVELFHEWVPQSDPNLGGDGEEGRTMVSRSLRRVRHSV